MQDSDYYDRVSTLLYYLESYVPEHHSTILKELSELKKQTDERYSAIG